jgi:hypothetical protein
VIDKDVIFIYKIIKRSIIMKKSLFFLLMLVNVLALGFSQTNSYTVSNVSTWVEAVGGIRNGGNNKEYEIIVTSNISVPSSTENTFGSVTGLTVTIHGNGSITPSANGNIIFIGSGQTVIAKDISLQGRNNNTSVIRVERGGTFRMEGNARVTENNNTSSNGGGVFVNGGTFIMQDSATITRNTNNSGSYGGGGGVYVENGTFTMQDSASITDNTINSGMWRGGGGVSVKNGTFTMRGDATISRNTVNTRGSGNGIAALGGGVYVIGEYGMATFIMQDNSSVSSNTITNERNNSFDSAIGGGVYVESKGYHTNVISFTMHGNSSITNNTSNGGGGGSFGGGVYISQEVGCIATFTMMNDASVSNNTARSSIRRNNSPGGGVYINNGATFTMQGNPSISNNTADGSGGGVYISSNDVNSRNSSRFAFNMEGGTISGNSANGNGGGVYFKRKDGFGTSTFVMQGNASVTNNIASNDGGGVFVESNWINNFIMRGNASVSNNNSNRNGGGVVGGGSDGTRITMQEDATISGNTANLGGGVILYIGSITIEGGIISGNTANNGGGIYITRGTLNKTGGIIYGYDVPINLANKSENGNTIHDENGGRWRNITAGISMNSEAYGFWLNDDIE